jgi:hypothetical protein
MQALPPRQRAGGSGALAEAEVMNFARPSRRHHEVLGLSDPGWTTVPPRGAAGCVRRFAVARSRRLLIGRPPAFYHRPKRGCQSMSSVTRTRSRLPRRRRRTAEDIGMLEGAGRLRLTLKRSSLRLDPRPGPAGAPLSATSRPRRVSPGPIDFAPCRPRPEARGTPVACDLATREGTLARGRLS